MSSDLHVGIPGLISQRNRKLVEEYAQKLKTPITRLVAIAIEKELMKDYPFSYDVSLPDEDEEPYVEEAFIDEAGRIINYMKKASGMPLDDMCLMRYDMGIPDKKTFLLAFRECLKVNQLEPYKPKQPPYATVKYDEDFVFYRHKDSNTVKARKIRKEANEIEQLHKLKKKYKYE